jgi:hypothetical protein
LSAARSDGALDASTLRGVIKRVGNSRKKVYAALAKV